MKVRIDFVTNSSSSSFIFGIPGGDTITLEGTDRMIKSFASDILEFVDKFYELADAAKLPRGKDQDIAYFDGDTDEKALAICKRLYKGSIFEKYDYNIGDVAYEICMLHPGNYEYDKLVEIKNKGLRLIDFTGKVKFNVEDFGDYDPGYGGDVIYNAVCDIGWFSDGTNTATGVSEEEQEIYTKRLKDLEESEEYIHYESDEEALKICHEYLGEVATFGYESGNIPEMLVYLMEQVATFACNHEG